MSRYHVLSLGLTLLLSPAICADDKARKEQELTQLTTKIEKLRKTIEVKESSKSSYTRQLRRIEKQIGDVSRQIRISDQAVKTKRKMLETLESNKTSIQKDIALHNQQLSQQLHAAYTLGQQERIKLFFSQQDPSNLQRNLTYYEYFSNFRLQQITASKQNFERLIQNQNKTIAAKSELEKVRSQQQQQKDNLRSDQSQRQKILAQLESQLKQQGTHLSQLEDDAKELKSLIESLSAILAENNDAPRSTEKFITLQGKLSWPVKGDVKKLFGLTKPPSNLLWQGVVIHATQGNNVRAVSHGRIAFADWLRGMGNLIIIDHGNGYLSLYGHNESLFKAAGEWVEAGDIIGSIGNSGGQSEPGLYFEIRAKGKPQNPANWCKTSNWFSSI
ncbi:MAG: peptidoglycan DD-metalloendopeptidase family protein [Gammaproteobacteria bacterium]|nr:peptidoglycan DD-metalloendopeptidase family protein [Gammaproteobacteria bacterium]